MAQEKWDRRFLELAKHVSSWSKDPSTKVGAVVVKDRIVYGMGFNGFPRGVEDSEERYNDRPTKYKFVVHAELNAILNAGVDCQGATIYVYFPSYANPPVCSECAKAVVQSGIRRVVGYNFPTSEKTDRWAEQLNAAQTICEESGVEVTLLELEDGVQDS